LEFDGDDSKKVGKVGRLLVTKAHSCSVAISLKVSVEISVKGSKHVDDKGGMMIG
jgi:hypothetical protein